MILGDLNADTNTWDQWQPEDKLGESIEDWMMEHDFGTANDGSATRVNAGTGGLSVPDITMIHNSKLGNLDWQVLESLGSDHLPMLTTMECCINTLKTTSSELKWNF